MKKKFLLSFLAILVAITFAGMAEAKGDRGNGREHKAHQGMMGGMLDITQIEELQLTQEQKTKIQKMRDAHLKEIYALEDSITAKGRELREALTQATPDENRVFSLKKDMGTLRHDMYQKRLEHRENAWKILSEEQKTTFRKLRMDNKQMMGGSCAAGMKEECMDAPCMDKGKSPRGRY
ncbi:MAG: periplasmic heavy metal sensor [Deltaproteobacteria bacterium]|nr:periplasmic heavy metal sensor [Deltaproteobacteria bacterium]